MTAVAHLQETQWSRRGRWAVAALIVVGLHASGLVLALMHQPDEAWDDPAGGVNVDMVAPPAPVPTKSEVDLARGPEQPVGKEAAEATKQVARKVEKDDPLVEPSPAPSPEVVLPTPRPEEKEQPKEEAQEAAKKTAQEEGEQLNTAPPRVEAQPAPAAVRSEGLSPVIARLQATWQKSMSRHLERHKRYPETARRLRLHGSVKVRFVLNREGRVTLAEIAESSGSPILDQEALATMKRASPWPAPPSEVPDRYLESSVRIDFTLK